MANYYTYLISSLPMLHFGMKPPFSFEKFIGICSRLIPEKDIEILNSIPRIEIGLYRGREPALRQWQGFEIALRNGLVKIRAMHKHLDPLKYMRRDGDTDSSVSHIATNVHRTLAILEAEKVLDQERWHFLEGLCFGHYFDLDFLIIYGLKLLILERWGKINSADKAKVLEEVLMKGQNG